METIVVPSPDCHARRDGDDWAAHSTRMFEHMERALAEHAGEVCAVIVEPLVQCAAGMRMYDPVYLSLLRDACDRHGVHLIADEIAVGFGRTGTLFACEQAGISPDFMCVSKGLTGGYLPLSAVLTTDDVYGAFYDDYARLTAFLHSHSYTGNPLACRVALATLSMFDDGTVLERNRATASRMGELAGAFRAHPHVSEVRQTGMIVAIEMARGGTDPYPWQERRGLRVYRHGLANGALLRPLGNVVYWMPPYVIADDELALLARVTAEGIDLATALFSESTARVIVTVPREDDVRFRGLCEGRGVPVRRIGVTDAASGTLEIQDAFTVSVDELRDVNRTPLADAFGPVLGH
jgi:adenosylmethionine-8-amino-7-oxononanoate aminotransferase